MSQVQLQKCPYCALYIREDLMTKHQMRAHKAVLPAESKGKKKVALKDEDLEEIRKDMSRHSVFDTDDPLVLASRDQDDDPDGLDEGWEEEDEFLEDSEGEESEESEAEEKY